MHLTPYAAKTDFCLYTQNSYLVYTTHGVDYSSVYLSERLENFITILEEHWESVERSFEENVWTWT